MFNLSVWTSVSRVHFKLLLQVNVGSMQKTAINPLKLFLCTRDIEDYKRYFCITGVEPEIELIFARACIFESSRITDSFKICPHHRASLGVGWKRRNAAYTSKAFSAQF